MKIKSGMTKSKNFYQVDAEMEVSDDIMSLSYRWPCKSGKYPNYPCNLSIQKLVGDTVDSDENCTIVLWGDEATKFMDMLHKFVSAEQELRRE